jgi:hypothetical protein
MGTEIDENRMRQRSQQSRCLGKEFDLHGNLCCKFRNEPAGCTAYEQNESPFVQSHFHGTADSNVFHVISTS